MLGFTREQALLHQMISLRLVREKKFRASRAFNKVAICLCGDKYMPDGELAAPSEAEIRLVQIIWKAVVRYINEYRKAKRAERLGYLPPFALGYEHRTNMAKR